MKLEFVFTIDDLVSQGRIKQEHLESVQSWMKTIDEPCVPTVIQEELIGLFLISCLNDIELTKKTIISFYKCRKNAPELFDQRYVNGNSVHTALSTIHMISLPVRTDKNYALHYFKIHDTNYQNFDLVSIMKASYMLADITLDTNPLPNGLVVIIDMKGFGLMHMTKMKIGAIKKYLQYLQEGFPMQLISIHILNGNYLLDRLMSIIKVFMKSELINMMHIHPAGINEAELFKVIPKNCLPKDYGGDLPAEKELVEMSWKQFRDKQQFWDLEEKMRKECQN